MWVIYALLSALMAALVAVFGKLGISKVDTTLATTVRSLIMASFLVIISIVFGKWGDSSVFHGRPFLFIVLAGIAGAMSWLFYFAALKAGLASSVAAVDRLSVVFVLLLAIAFLGERLTLFSGIGALLVVAGAILMSIK